jgi:hypothetical protein
MTFFDCIYLNVSKFYSKANNEKFSGFYGLSILALAQFFNIFSLVICVGAVLHEKFSMPKWSAVVAVLLLLFVNGIRYYHTEPDTLQTEWQGFTEKKRKIWSTMMFIYIFGSVGIGLFLAAYFSNKR